MSSPGRTRWTYCQTLRAFICSWKNCGVAELSCRALIDGAVASKFSSGHFDNFEVQVASKLVNGNLSDIKPIIQVRTEQILDREIGRPREWTKFNAYTLSQTIMKHVSGRVVFGEALADNPAFMAAMERYTMKVIPYAVGLRYLNLGPLRDVLMFFIHLRQRHHLAAATRFVTDEIATRKRAQSKEAFREEQRPVDCVQWAMDQEIAEEAKRPESIAHRLLHLSAAIVDTPRVAMMNLLYDMASHGDCLDEIRAEIVECLADSGGGWTEASMANMKKLDSFIQECLRMNPGIVMLTGWRIVMADSFRFDDDLTLPKGTTLVFPTAHMFTDPDYFPNPDQFDPLRFYRMKEEARQSGSAALSKDIRFEWLTFGYGRQACPGRFYSLRLLKTILGEIIMRYDVRYAGGERPRPPSLDLEPLTVPDPTIELEFRARD
ncbi:cytochrome P450 [Aspergillus egyptiacus]|nr:cytochrome P450 [Aspergillus egyptiacus]